MRFLKFLIVFLSFNASTQVLFVGNHTFEPYIGFPNVVKYVPFISLNEEPANVTSYKGLPPSGFRYSYMLTDDISCGIDVIYQRSKQEFGSTDTTFQNGSWQYSYTGVRFQTRLRVQGRLNFHLPITQPNADSYIGIGFGTNNRWVKDYRNGVLDRTFSGREAILIPFSMRVCYGYRYYFSYYLGIVGEIGVGGPLFSFGLTYKL